MTDDLSAVEALYTAALKLAPAERAAFLDEACREHPDRRAEVERLLAAHGAAGAFLEPNAAVPPTVSQVVGEVSTATWRGAAGTASFGAPPERGDSGAGLEPGAVIAGRYRLAERIGEGGMGSVWLAHQTEPVKRSVAVKVIKAGMDSRAVLARFEAERQALALMDHPNIAKVLDAGATADGRPFFVMELVKGTPITEFCDARRLGPRERLELFVPVCQAIQHAHQKGIIHRDIKPSNVLVALYDERPVVKVIDFGVAKATGPGAELGAHTGTGFGAVVGTPEYMSPEQATFNNLDIDTRTDVYALGVLLYELLAGAPPFSRRELERKGLLEMLRVVREEEPPKPSAKLSTADAKASISANRGTEPRRLTALLRGELDWIVMRALDKDRNRRYETANGFAADVQRYLAGEPVQAVPPSRGYRFRKFLKRNKGPALATTLVFAALVCGVAGTALGLIEAKTQEAEAKKQETEANTQKEKAANEAAEKGRALEAVLAREKELAASRGETVAALYDARMLTLREALQSGNVARTRALLDTMRPAPGEPDPRGIEWHAIDNQMHGARTTVVVQPTLDGKRMYALPELYDNGRVVLFRQNAPNGYYYDAVAYDPETGNPLAGFEPVRGRYREQQDMNYLRFFSTEAEPGKLFLHSTAQRKTTFNTQRGPAPPGEFAVYDARTGGKVADVPDAVLEPELVTQGWQRGVEVVSHTFFRPWHLERGLCIDVFTRDIRTPAPDGPDTEMLLRLRDFKAGRVLCALDPIPGNITVCRFSPDGRHFLLVRNTAPRFKPASPNGQPLGATELSLWEVDSGKRLWTQAAENTNPSFTDGGKTVTLTSSGEGVVQARVFDTQSGALVSSRPSTRRDYKSPGGRWVVRVDGNRLEVLDAKALGTWRTIWTDQAVYQVAFPDDDRLLRVLEMPTTSGARCSTWDLPTAQVPKPAPQVPSRAGTSPFDLDGIFGSQVSPGGKVWLCDVRGANELTPPNQAQEKEREWGCGLTEATGGVRREFRVRAEFHPFWLTKRLFRGLDPAIEHSGCLIAFPIRQNAPPSGDAGTPGGVGIAVADFTSQSVRPITPFEKLGTHYHSPTFSPDGGRLLLMHGHELSVRDVRDGREVARVKYAEAQRAPEFATYSPDGRWMVVGSRNAGSQQGGELLVHDAATGELKHTRALRSTQESQKIDQFMNTTWKWVADGRKLAIFFNGEATLWDTETWAAVCRQEVRVGRGHRFERVVFADDGSHFASLTSSSTPQQTRLQVTDARTSRHKFPDPIAFRSVAWVAFTPDSQRLAVLGEDEFATDQQAPLVLQIWDPHRAQLRYTTKTPLDLSARGLVNGATLVGTFEHGGGTLRLVKDKQTVPDRASSYVLDARPRTPEQVVATPRPNLVPPQPDANEGPVVFADNRNTIRVLFPQQIRLYTQNPSSASNFADVAVLSQGEAKVRAWREAAKRDPDCAPLQRELGIALRELNRLDESEAALRKALELDRRSAETHFELGTVLRARNGLADALAPLREAARLDPSFATARTKLGECFQDLGRLDEAIATYEAAIVSLKRLHPAFFHIPALPLYKRLGELHWRQKNFDSAAAAFGEAVPHATYDTNLLVWWSVALRDAGKAREADEAFARAKAANESAAHLARAEIQFHQSKNLAGAAADYRIAAELIKAAGPFNDLGCVLRDQGKTDEAFKAFDRATALDAKLWLPYRNRAYMSVEARQPAKAVPEFDQAIALCPLNDHTKTLLRTHRATARVNAGQVALGLAEIDEVSKLPDLPALVLYDCACAYGLATGRTPDKTREYGDTAMALLRRAVAGGFVNVAHMRRDTDLDALRDRADLKALFAELETKQALPVAPAPREPSKWSPWIKE